MINISEMKIVKNYFKNSFSINHFALFWPFSQLCIKTYVHTYTLYQFLLALVPINNQDC